VINGGEKDTERRREGHFNIAIGLHKLMASGGRQGKSNFVIRKENTEQQQMRADGWIDGFELK
jgi:hypothetical protein